MEQSFQSLLTGKYTAGDYTFPPITFSGETYLTNETYPHTQSLLPSLNHPYTSPHNPFDENTLTRCSCRCRCIDENLKRLKTEPSPEPFLFPFNRLPDLRSIEQVNQEKNFTPVPLKLTARDLEHRRRHAISNKTRALRNLIPAEKKMDTAAVYEEAYKYIKFLQAQISVLESMPDSFNFRSGNGNGTGNPRCGGLGELELDRREVLNELVNSPKAQAVMYSSGCCVYSVEQLVVVKEVMEKGFFVSGYGF